MENKFNHKLCEDCSKLREYELEKNDISLNATNNLFSIIMPPPNLTGVLHIGHAWNGTIQDFLIRYETLKKNNAIWFMGTDHAGIATQTKYENFLREKKEYSKLEQADRENKIRLLNEWAQNNGNTIKSQWEKMGFMLDYNHGRFTLDENANKLVLNTFVDFYKKGLIYQDWKLINWDVRLKTAISNIEVIKKDVDKKMYYIKYFYENSNNEYISIATTRPETIFVDKAIFVHPTDKKYKNVIGKKVINPLTKELIPIMADEYIDKEFGTGAMKCTPAHDFNDYDLGKKYNLETISCINYDGTMNENAKDYIGLDRLECQKKVVEFFKNNNLLIKEESIISNVGFSERTGEVVEPMLSKQWFVKMKPLAKKILDNQKTDNKVNIYPIKFEKTLINWLKNIDDWCISRQLWWGHQIPVWYHKETNEVYVDVVPPKDEENWIRDNDVLDTWFSSGLWPLVVTQNNNSKFFPTNVLVTAYDIIFFWVVRMLAFSIEIKNQIPFKDVLITGLIRDEKGRKMSKSLNNGIDPNKVVEEKGADALRLLLLSGSSPGEDIRFSNTNLDASWTFLNKLWNVFRYIMSFKDLYNPNLKIDNNLLSVDIWIINKFNDLFKSVYKNFENYNILVGVNKIVNFIKNDFCNSYVELNKTRMKNNDLYLIFTLFEISKNILILLHPICPFITNYLYDLLPNKKQKTIIHESFDFIKIKQKDVIVEDVLSIINAIRIYRFENKLSKKEQVKIDLFSSEHKHFLEYKSEITSILSNENICLESIQDKQLDENLIILNNFSIFIKNKINNNNQTEQIEKEIEKIKFEIERANKMLSNKGFVSKAPKEKIELEKKKKSEYEKKLKDLLEIIKK